MSLYNSIREKSMFIGDIINGTKLKSSFDFLMKSQWWSKEEIKNYQEAKLQLLIKHAFDNVPYYRELFIKNKVQKKSGFRFIAKVSP